MISSAAWLKVLLPIFPLSSGRTCAAAAAAAAVVNCFLVSAQLQGSPFTQESAVALQTNFISGQLNKQIFSVIQLPCSLTQSETACFLFFLLSLLRNGPPPLGPLQCVTLLSASCLVLCLNRPFYKVMTRGVK